MTKSIFLSNGKECLVDDDDYQWASQYKWHESGKGYALRNKQVNGRSATVRMHRELLQVHQGLEVDHINGNRLDNRRSNLRPATRQENVRNRKVQKNNKCGFKGVSCEKGRFRAYICVNNKLIHLGMFTTAEEAARARDKAEKELFGEFSRLNFPEVPA
jgi:hypothetical protein